MLAFVYPAWSESQVCRRRNKSGWQGADGAHLTRKAHVIERCDGLGSVVAPRATSKQCRRGAGCCGALAGGRREVRAVRGDGVVGCGRGGGARGGVWGRGGVCCVGGIVGRGGVRLICGALRGGKRQAAGTPGEEVEDAVRTVRGGKRVLVERAVVAASGPGCFVMTGLGVRCDTRCGVGRYIGSWRC